MRELRASADISIWQEALFGTEVMLLRAAPVYLRLRGDQSGVVVFPGFLGMDLYLVELYAWLKRMG